MKDGQGYRRHERFVKIEKKDPIKANIIRDVIHRFDGRPRICSFLRKFLYKNSGIGIL